MNLQETYNRIAEDWHAQHMSDDWWVEGTMAFVEHLPKNGKVLDVGCGGGTKSRFLIEQGLRVMGIDFSSSMVAIAKREVPQGEFRTLDLFDVARLGEMFNGIFAQAVLLHVAKNRLDEAVQGFVRKLHDNGLLYVAVKGKQGNVDEEVVKEKDLGYEYERFFSYYTPGEIASAFEKNGLTVIFQQVNRAGETDWIQVIGKKTVKANL